MPATVILLIRHTDVHNPQDVFYGRIPRFRLSDVGTRQAENTARALEGLPLQRIYSSPQLRARQTARILSAHLNVAVAINSGLAELHNSLQGTPWKVLGKEPNVYEPRRHPGDESIADIFARMHRALHTLRRRHQGQMVAAISHADPIMILRVGHLGGELKIESLRGPEYPQKGSITRFEFIDDAEVAQVTYTDVNKDLQGPPPPTEQTAEVATAPATRT